MNIIPPRIPTGHNFRPSRRMVLVLDASGSMDERDIAPFRLAAAAEAVTELTTNALAVAGNEVGLVSFSTDAFVVVPPTSCASHLINLARLLVPWGSTNFGAGLALAREQLGNSPSGCGEVVFLSDGHNQEGPAPLPMADLIKSCGFTIDTIGVGGSPGDVDEDLLRAIASPGPDGRPRYRFIRDRGALIEHFRSLGTGMTR